MTTEPPHPGQIVRLHCLSPHQLSVADGARVLGVTRQALNNLVNGHCGISADMALRLASAFGTDAESWLQHQMAYDLAKAKKRPPKVAPVGNMPRDQQARLL